MSVITTPSTAHTDWSPSEPGPTYCDCWPLSLPPTLMRSVSTPGVDCRMAQGSRAVGIFSSSVWLTVAPVEIRRSSSSGDSAVTVITSSTAAFIVTSISVLRPTLIEMFGYSTLEKPSSCAFNL